MTMSLTATRPPANTAALAAARIMSGDARDGAAAAGEELAAFWM